jgi:RND family efflux transporter MFP subunit
MIQVPGMVLHIVKLVIRVGLTMATGGALVAGLLSARSPRDGTAGVPTLAPTISERTMDSAVRVHVARARTGELIQHQVTTGTLRANREVTVQARVDGYLTGCSAFNGKSVRQGEGLVSIDSRTYRIAFERARAGLLNAQIEYRTLSATPYLATTDSVETARRVAAESRLLDSLRMHLRSGRIDDATYDRLFREHESEVAYLTANRGDVIAARSGLAAARETFETARLNLEWTSVNAPFDGVVADCALAPGMHVSTGEVLMSLLDLSTLLVDVEILENEVSRVAVGQRARIHLAGLAGVQQPGTVLAMNPLIDPKTKTMKVTIALREHRQGSGSPRSMLRPGMHATVQIETNVLPHRLLVPRSALLERDERTLLFTVDHGRAKWHYVETGEANDELLEIRSGIAAGDTVIVDGHFTLAHDAPVSIIPHAP